MPKRIQEIIDHIDDKKDAPDKRTCTPTVLVRAVSAKEIRDESVVRCKNHTTMTLPVHTVTFLLTHCLRKKRKVAGTKKKLDRKQSSSDTNALVLASEAAASRCSKSIVESKKIVTEIPHQTTPSQKKETVDVDSALNEGLQRLNIIDRYMQD